MSGDPENVSLWADADVFVGVVGTSIVPTDVATAFDATWDLAGLLDGDDGVTTTRDQETNDYYAWGGLLVKTSRRNFKLTKKFSALEDNATTRGLIWPGSTATELIVPKPGPILLAFELREGTKVRRAITKNHAIVDVDGDVTENETDLTKYPLVATIYPDAAGVLFTIQESA